MDVTKYLEFQNKMNAIQYLFNDVDLTDAERLEVDRLIARLISRKNDDYRKAITGGAEHV